MQDDFCISKPKNIIKETRMIIMCMSQKDIFDLLRIYVCFLQFLLETAKTVRITRIDQHISVFYRDHVIIHYTVSQVIYHYFLSMCNSVIKSDSGS